MSNLDKITELEDEFKSNKLIITSINSLETLEQFYSPPEDENNSVSFFNFSSDKLLEGAVDIIKSQGNDISNIFENTVRHIVPLETAKGDFQNIGIGFSSHLAKGAIFLNSPFLNENSALQLAINIAHETGHQALYIYQTADPIIENGIDTPVYSYVRKIDRPAIQSFHASVALAFMVRFLTQLNKGYHSDYHQKVLEKLVHDFTQSLNSYKNIQFTEFGELLLEDLRCYACEL